MAKVRAFLARHRLAVALASAAPAVIVLSSLERPAFAQSAADKATARRLAREGIDLHKAGKFTEALDKLQRAESLYDAPIHVVYIARCQAELGQFVEAAENYRKLARLQLPGDAPQAFKDAVADAKKELPGVEPKIGALRIDVEPANVDGLKVEIDGVAVPAAAVGVDRESNPGTRKVTASAPGYKSAEAEVTLKPGGKQSVKLTLEKDLTAPPPGAGSGEGKPDGGAGAAKPDKTPDSSGKDEVPPGLLGYLVSVRIGGALTGGQIVKNQSMPDYLPSGGGAELRLGVRVAQHYNAFLLGSAYSYNATDKLRQGTGTTVDARPTGTDAGVGFMYAPKREDLGPFGELDLLFIHRFDVNRDVQPLDGSPSCSQSFKASGAALRLAGGIQIPMLSWLNLSPYAAVSLGQIGELSVSDDCKGVYKGIGAGNLAKEQATPWKNPGSVGSDQRAVHFVLTLGVGGDIVFGSDKSSK